MEFAASLALSAVMGLSIYLSLPIVLHRGTGERRILLLTAVATGILVFLMGDIFTDAADSLYNGSLYGYGSSPSNDVLFSVSLCAGFFLLYFMEARSKTGMTPSGLALVIAVGMGFQNLTEGLVFGSLSVAFGLSGGALVVLVGFVLQNITEGFPIASPFLGRSEGKGRLILALFLVGGLPTVAGGAVGYYYQSQTFDLVFYGVAIGAILYAILPMFRAVFRSTTLETQRLGYLGVFLGFLLGFLVNLV